MSLRDWITVRLAGAGFKVALFNGEREISARGYARQAVPAGLAGPVLFGPFPQTTRFDRVVLMDGDGPVEVLFRFDQPIVLPPDSDYEHDLMIEVL